MSDETSQPMPSPIDEGGFLTSDGKRRLEAVMAAKGLRQGDVAVELGAGSRLNASIGRALTRGSAIRDLKLAAALGPWLAKMEETLPGTLPASEPVTGASVVSAAASARDAPISMTGPHHSSEAAAEKEASSSASTPKGASISRLREQIAEYRKKDAERKTRDRERNRELQQLRRERKAAASSESKRERDRVYAAKKRAARRVSESSPTPMVASPISDEDLQCGYDARLTALLAATTTGRRSRSLVKMRGNEASYVLWWKARQIARSIHGAKASASQVAACRNVISRGAGEFSKKQAENALARIDWLEAAGAVWCGLV